MGVIIDLIGSMVVRASIIAIVLNLMVNLHEALYKYTERNYLNETLNSAVQTISSDLRLAGYNASTKRFPKAQSDTLSFRADIDDNGTEDIIQYYTNPTTGPDKVLYRTVNSGPAMQVARDVDTFYVIYYRNTGTPVTGSNVNNIKSVNVLLRIASNSRNRLNATPQSGSSESTARKVTWQQHFFPENQ